MASLPRVIDVEDVPELERIVSEVNKACADLVIRKNGEEVALVRPLKPPASRSTPPIITEADIEATMSAAGGWADVDTDRLLRDIYADRDVGDRPPVDW